MDGMIQLYAQYKETLEKRSMGFRMSAWDQKLLKYGEKFEAEMMALKVNIPLEKALDLGWQIMAQCFEPLDVGMRSELLDKFWPKDVGAKTGEPQEASSTAS
jgi:V/A-type H+-transporting ATPase subunit B